MLRQVNEDGDCFCDHHIWRFDMRSWGAYLGVWIYCTVLDSREFCGPWLPPFTATRLHEPWNLCGEMRRVSRAFLDLHYLCPGGLFSSTTPTGSYSCVGSLLRVTLLLAILVTRCNILRNSWMFVNEKSICKFIQ